MGFEWKCPFHSFMAGAAVFGTLYVLMQMTQRRTIERIDVDGRFSEAIKANGFIFVTGQVGSGRTIEEQTIATLRYIDGALRKAGSNKKNIVDCTIFLADIEADFEGMNSVYDAWIAPGKPPCRSCVEGRLSKPGYRVEIKVTAVVQ